MSEKCHRCGRFLPTTYLVGSEDAWHFENAAAAPASAGTTVAVCDKCSPGQRFYSPAADLMIALKRAEIRGPNTVSVDGDGGPFDTDAARVAIWFRSWNEAQLFADFVHQLAKE